MKTEITCIRLTPEQKSALRAAAEAEDRSMAYVIERATLEWLRRNGYLKPEKRADEDQGNEG